MIYSMVSYRAKVIGVEAYRVDDFEKLQNHKLLALQSTRLQYFKNREKSMRTYDQVFDFCVLP